MICPPGTSVSYEGRLKVPRLIKDATVHIYLWLPALLIATFLVLTVPSVAMSSNNCISFHKDTGPQLRSRCDNTVTVSWCYRILFTNDVEYDTCRGRQKGNVNGTIDFHFVSMPPNPSKTGAQRLLFINARPITTGDVINLIDRDVYAEYVESYEVSWFSCNPATTKWWVIPPVWIAINDYWRVPQYTKKNMHCAKLIEYMNGPRERKSIFTPAEHRTHKKIVSRHPTKLRELHPDEIERHKEPLSQKSWMEMYIELQTAAPSYPIYCRSRNSPKWNICTAD